MAARCRSKPGVGRGLRAHWLSMGATPRNPVPAPVAEAVTFTRTERLDGETLSLWVLDGAGVDPTQLDLSVLDTRESRQADLLVDPRDRLRYVLAHVSLRHLLGEQLALRPEQIVDLREPCPACGAPRGRPAVASPPLPVHFSLSVSGDVIVVGIASTPVGVDVEAVAGEQVPGEVIGLLHPEEQAELNATPRPDRAAAFTRLWTRKEAYLKGLGVGVAHGLADDYLGTEARSETPAGWSLLDVPVPAAFLAVAALRTGPVPGDRAERAPIGLSRTTLPVQESDDPVSRPGRSRRMAMASVRDGR